MQLVGVLPNCGISNPIINSIAGTCRGAGISLNVNSKPGFVKAYISSILTFSAPVSLISDILTS